MTIDVPAIIPFILAGALMLWALVTVGLAFTGGYNSAGLPEIHSRKIPAVETAVPSELSSQSGIEAPTSESRLVVASLYLSGIGVMGLLILMLAATVIW